MRNTIMASGGPKAALIPFLNECPQGMRNVFLKIGLGVIQSPQDRSKVLKKVSMEWNIEKSKLIEVIAIYVEIIKLYLVTKDKEFCELLAELGFNPEFIKELPLLTHREEVEQAIRESYNTRNRCLLSFKWRIDLSLYNELSNDNAKSVIIQINQSNERKTTLKVDIKTFHMLRYNIALILKEISSLKEKLV